METNGKSMKSNGNQWKSTKILDFYSVWAQACNFHWFSQTSLNYHQQISKTNQKFKNMFWRLFRYLLIVLIPHSNFRNAAGHPRVLRIGWSSSLDEFPIRFLSNPYQTYLDQEWLAMADTTVIRICFQFLSLPFPTPRLCQVCLSAVPRLCPSEVGGTHGVGC